MSTTDTLTLVQTLIALFTCLLLLWYIVATNRLQRQAQEQNRIQKERLDVAKTELSQALFRERKLLVPYIRWRGGASGANEEKWEFENLGADITNVRWTATNGIRLEYAPPHLVRTFDEGFIQLRADQTPISYPLRFSLAFTNRFGEACTTDFEIPAPAKEPKEVLPYKA